MALLYNKLMNIAVSLYEKTAQDLINQINKLSPYFSSFQIDISDGIYAPNKTVQIEEIISNIYDLGSMIYDLTFDFHLMVNDYKTELKKIISLKDKINIGNILIHYSLKPHLQSLITNYKLPSGLVLNSQDQVENLVKDYDLQKIPIIQIMTVQTGAQGNPFLPENIKKIEQLKKVGFSGKIFLDGGINEKTLPIILSKKYQPDVLCVGSYLTKSSDLKSNIFVHDRKQISDF